MPAYVRCIVKCNHSFLLLEQLKDIVIASLFPKHKLCEATVKILDLLTAITCTETKKTTTKNPPYHNKCKSCLSCQQHYTETTYFCTDICV